MQHSSPRMRRLKQRGKPPARKNRRRTDILLLARNLAAAVLVVELLRAAFASPRLAVDAVQVTGSKRVPPIRVAQLSGVRGGGNIFAVDLQRARQQVLTRG
jgi:cell division septal protein FtsQ